MGEHRAVIGARMAGFAAVRQLWAAEATFLTGCTISPPTCAAQGWRLATAEARVSAGGNGAFGQVDALFDSDDGLAGAILDPEAAQ
ncbi:hypothetical protein [Bosea sp. (in: a-proteobacteria)]|uniref:hypothetical protein n=1 Tax=Bosea sp. (in: a-proteobacteria) TaxID=1871050 RepID=UPI002B481286|nr:hypothetical protein [Bosea sp. (in: a-proteobacteria)]WRH60126.1 MAG: hypothetical protein RSE11_10280 [Bosea sp. (in: a-proteobacteria)]